jgi:hypothetical protein
LLQLLAAFTSQCSRASALWQTKALTDMISAIGLHDGILTKKHDIQSEEMIS